MRVFAPCDHGPREFERFDTPDVLSVLASTIRPQWSSAFRFVIVTTAAIVGLSNLWRLPYLLAEYGGGAFLLVYVLALLCMGLPLFSGQLLMARGTSLDVPGVIEVWRHKSPHSRLWSWGGYLAVVGAALLLAAYSVIASWSLAYCLRAVTGTLAVDTIADSREHFVAFVRDPERGFGWLLLFFCLLCATGARGLKRGVEPVMRTLAVCMFAAFAALFVSALWSPVASDTARELFVFDASRLGARGVLEALYQAFFTLSLGTGVIVALGSYLPDNARVIRLSLVIIVVDVAAALVAAFMLAVFVAGQDVALGDGLQSVFEILPVVLGDSWRTPIMFVLIALVSVSTAIGLFEPVVQLVSQRWGLTRLRSSVRACVVLALIGLLGQLSFGVLGDWRLLDRNVFGWLLLTATHVIGPFCGLFLCLLLGRVLARRRLVAAWNGGGASKRKFGFALWHGLLRYPTRIALIAVLVYVWGGYALIQKVWG